MIARTVPCASPSGVKRLSASTALRRSKRVLQLVDMMGPQAMR